MSHFVLISIPAKKLFSINQYFDSDEWQRYTVVIPKRIVFFGFWVCIVIFIYFFVCVIFFVILWFFRFRLLFLMSRIFSSRYTVDSSLETNLHKMNVETTKTEFAID